MPKCRSCASDHLTVFLRLGNIPLVDALPSGNSADGPEPRYPLNLAFCADCSLVQITDTVPPEELFCRDYPYYSSFSDALLEHSKQNVHSIIESRGLNGESLVVELASNDGYLLQFYKQRGISVLGIDPAEGPAQAAVGKGIPTLCEFFDARLADRLRQEGKQADVIHANNVLAHVPDLNGFVAGIAALLKPGGVAVIEAPYVKDLIDHVEFDTIYHEHHCYFSVTALAGLFRRHGLALQDVRPLSIHGGSLRLFVGKNGAPRDAVRQFLDVEAAGGVSSLGFYEGFAARVTTVARDLLSLLRDLKQQGKTVAGYGAAAKGAVLLNYAGIDRELLDFVVDRNVHKQGRFMPGVGIPILAPQALLEKMPDCVLVLAWNFADEIMAQQAEYQRRGGRFIVPIPSLEIR